MKNQQTTPKSEFGNKPLQLGILSIVMIPISILFLNANSRIGLFFLFGSPILAITALIYLKGYSGELAFFNTDQLNKYKNSKIICIVSLVISLLTISLGIFQLMSDSI